MYVVFDTMVYLHCQQIQDIDLTILLGVPAVTLVVPRITLQELDKHKNTHQSQKVRDRASERLKTIKSSLFNPSRSLRAGVSIELLNRLPIETAKQHGLSIEWPDDQLIASVLELRERHTHDDVILISHDTGLQLTAMEFGITVMEIPETLRIPPEEDPLVSENKRLRNEILRMHNARPQLIVRLSEMQDTEDHIVFHLAKPQNVEIENRSEVLARLRQSYPPRHPPALKPSPDTEIARLTALLASQRFEQIPESEYERYNKDLERFFAKYEQYLDTLAAYLEPITLNLNVRNVGGEPAEDVDIYIHFPDGFALYLEDDLPKEPGEPLPPTEPQTETQKLFSRTLSTLNIPSSFPTLSAVTKNTFSLKRTTGSYELQQHFERIKHGYLMRIRPIFLVFTSFEKAQSFGFEYEITAGNMPDQVSGKLHVVIEKDR
jgi:rRNA-processing protein FCF1